MYNGEIVGCTVSDHPDLKMVLDVLNLALSTTPTQDSLLLRSDQGWHYQHCSYQKALRDHGIVQSMGRKGNCLDNAMMENFFGIMKSELLYPNEFKSMESFKVQLKDYIEYYNNERITSRLKRMSPVQYRTRNFVLF